MQTQYKSFVVIGDSDNEKHFDFKYLSSEDLLQIIIDEQSRGLEDIHLCKILQRLKYKKLEEVQSTIVGYYASLEANENPN